MDKYYTVTEYANLTGKDAGNVRRMLINGVIKGEKIGKQWVIAKEDAIVPEDKRVKSGKYCGSRKKALIRQRYPMLSDALRKMCLDLENIYGDDLEKIVLYGSYARGEETPESDVDIALVLKDDRNEKKHSDMINTVAEYELEQGLVLSVVPIVSTNYEQWKRVLPFYRSIAKEGILLWTNK